MISNLKNEATAIGCEAQMVKKSAKTSNRISPFNRVITSARKLYARQLDQNASVKNRCMERNVTKYYDEPEKFWAEFESRKEDILDRGTFKARCEKEGLNPQNVAEHLLFEGSGVVKKSLETGFAHLKGRHMTYTEPITTRTYRVVRAEAKQEPARNRGLRLPAHSESMANPLNVLVEKTA